MESLLTCKKEAFLVGRLSLMVGQFVADQDVASACIIALREARYSGLFLFDLGRHFQYTHLQILPVEK